MKTITIDPKIFISPPYRKCPKCNSPDSFGVLMICDRYYIRRCEECLYDSRYNLPELRKKVIYIDQFAVSNMMKALNSQTRTYQKGTLGEFWLKLYERLDSLCKLQLIICPYSDIQYRESILAQFSEPLKIMYEHLSGSVSFYDFTTIKGFQLYEHAQNWISKKDNEVLKLYVDSIVEGNINAWQGRLRISVNLPKDQDWIDRLRKMRDKTPERLSGVFQRWQTEKNKTFNDWFEEENMSIGKTALQVYFKPPASIWICSIKEAFRKAEIQDSEIWAKTIEYGLVNVKDKIFEKGLNIENFAKEIKIDRGRLKLMLNNEIMAKPKDQRRIAVFFNVNPEEIFSIDKIKIV